MLFNQKARKVGRNFKINIDKQPREHKMRKALKTPLTMLSHQKSLYITFIVYALKNFSSIAVLDFAKI